MKKIASITRCLALCFTMFIGHTDVIKAENTDISEIENVAYIAPFEARQGSQIELSVRMKNAVGIRGYEFDLSLPEGMTFVRDGETNGYIFKTNADRAASYSPAGNVSANDRTTHVLGSTLTGVDISGSDGEILTVKVNVDGNMAVGDYEITMSNIDLGTQNTLVSYKTAVVKMTVTILEHLILDENSTDVPSALENANFTVKRTINAGKWSTICLPFEMSEEKLKSVFGDDVQLAEFTDYETDEDELEAIIGITINFSEIDLSDGFYANYPYLIKTSKNISTFEMESTTIDPDEEDCVAEYDNGKVGNKRKVYGSFIGTYHAQTLVPQNCLFINNDRYFYSNGNTQMKAFRAYFKFVHVLSELEGAGARIMMTVGDETTRIDARTMEPIETGKVYNLAGQYVGELESSDHLPKGVYIVNGKKKVIK